MLHYYTFTGQAGTIAYWPDEIQEAMEKKHADKVAREKHKTGGNKRLLLNNIVQDIVRNPEDGTGWIRTNYEVNLDLAPKLKKEDEHGPEGLARWNQIEAEWELIAMENRKNQIIAATKELVLSGGKFDVVQEYRAAEKDANDSVSAAQAKYDQMKSIREAL